jgi:hypothetical protein
MGYLLQTVEGAYVVEGVYGRREATMWAEYRILDESLDSDDMDFQKK